MYTDNIFTIHLYHSLSVCLSLSGPSLSIYIIIYLAIYIYVYIYNVDIDIYIYIYTVCVFVFFNVTKRGAALCLQQTAILSGKRYKCVSSARIGWGSRYHGDGMRAEKGEGQCNVGI